MHSSLSDDEVVWSLSESSVREDSENEDDDFVVLSKSSACSHLFQDSENHDKARPTASGGGVQGVAELQPLLEALAIGETTPIRGKKNKKRCKRAKTGKAASNTMKSAKTSGVAKGTPSSETPQEMYKEASFFITSFLANPVAKRDAVCRLTLLQSLIVELGFIPAALPSSLRAARAFLKAHVFINIKEYLAHRGQGQAALQKLLHPSKKALIKDIRRKGHAAPRGWVKEQGLEVLLVPCYYH